jgi:hypothetical protein
MVEFIDTSSLRPTSKVYIKTINSVGISESYTNQCRLYPYVHNVIHYLK